MRCVWPREGSRKWAVFLFNLSSYDHVYIVKYPFTSRDDWSENLGETAVLACKMFTSLIRCLKASNKLFLMLSGDICIGVPLNGALRIAKKLGFAEHWNYPQPWPCQVLYFTTSHPRITCKWRSMTFRRCLFMIVNPSFMEKGTTAMMRGEKKVT